MRLWTGHARAAKALGGLVGSLCLACSTTMSPMQRQQLETRIYDAPYETIYSVSRDALANHGYSITATDATGGIVSVAHPVLRHNPAKAVAFSLLLPPAGDIYTERYGWALFDTLLWPYSIIWSVPSNLRIARSRTTLMTGTLSLEPVGPEMTRTRITLWGIDWDAQRYPTLIRGLQEEIDRQLFLRSAETHFDLIPTGIDPRANTATPNARPAGGVPASSRD